MFKSVWFLLLLASSLVRGQSVGPASSPASRGLVLEKCTMPLTTATATLIVGPLARTNGIYAGDFKVKVFPYFFKSDWGRLAIQVPDTALTAMNLRQTVAISGTSTSTKNGMVRDIHITAVPQDGAHGTVRLWFMVEDQKMIFTTAYQFKSRS